MTFSKEWDETYANGDHLSIWPWSDLVSLVHRFSKLKKNKSIVLELGCGAGANIPLFLDLKFDYHAVDGSQNIINFLHEKFPKIKSKIIKSDFTKTIPFKKKFDLIVDRSSLISNDIIGVNNGLKILSSKLKPNGLFIATDWFSEQHDGFNLGKILDEQTRYDFPKNSEFSGIGNIHFCNKEYLKKILSKHKLQIIYQEHKLVETELGNKNETKGFWNFVCKKYD